MTDTPNTLAFSRPDGDALRRAGWQVASQIGKYCVAWKGREETVFLWQDDRWEAISVPLRKAG